MKPLGKTQKHKGGEYNRNQHSTELSSKTLFSNTIYAYIIHNKVHLIVKYSNTFRNRKNVLEGTYYYAASDKMSSAHVSTFSLGQQNNSSCQVAVTVTFFATIPQSQ